MADVALLNGDRVEAIVEICVTHAVDTDKAIRLDRLPWIELHGPSVVLDPLRWHSMATGNLRPARERMCEECTAIETIRPRWSSTVANRLCHGYVRRRGLPLLASLAGCETAGANFAVPAGRSIRRIADGRRAARATPPECERSGRVRRFVVPEVAACRG